MIIKNLSSHSLQPRSQGYEVAPSFLIILQLSATKAVKLRPRAFSAKFLILNLAAKTQIKCSLVVLPVGQGGERYTPLNLLWGCAAESLKL